MNGELGSIGRVKSMSLGTRKYWIIGVVVFLILTIFLTKYKEIMYFDDDAYVKCYNTPRLYERALINPIKSEEDKIYNSFVIHEICTKVSMKKIKINLWQQFRLWMPWR